MTIAPPSAAPDRGVGRHRDHEVGPPRIAGDASRRDRGGARQDARVEQVEDDRERDREHHVAAVAEGAADLERDEGARRRRTRPTGRGGRRWRSSGGLLRCGRASEVRATKASSRSAPVTSRSRIGRSAANSARTVRSASVEVSRTLVAADLDVGHAGQARPAGRGRRRRGRSRIVRPRSGRGSHRPVPSATIRPWSQDDDPVGDLVGLLEVMGREQDRPALGGRPAHVRPERPPGLDVHRHRRLVEEHEVGVAGDRDARTGGAGAPRPTAARPTVGQRRQAGPFEDGRLRRVGAGRAGARTRRARRRGRSSAGRLPGASSRPGRWRRPPGGMPSVRDRAVRRLEQAEHQADRRRLAGAVRPEQRDRLAGPDGQVEAVEREDVAEAAGDAVEMDRARGTAAVSEPRGRAAASGSIW